MRVGLVSASGTGKKRTLPALCGSEICGVTAVHARDPQKARELAEEFQIPYVYSDLERMITDHAFDVAMACSPPFLHVEQVQALMRAGIPTLCEKPLAVSVADAVAIRTAAEGSGTLVMIAHQLRHQNIYREIDRALEAQEIGEVGSATMEWSFPLDRTSSSARWKLDPTLNGPTCLTDAGIHCVDVVIGLFGPGQVQTATAPGWQGAGVVEDCTVVSTHSGVEVTIRASWLRGSGSNDLVIEGTRGKIEAPRFFTRGSAPFVRVTSGTRERLVERSGDDPYRMEVEDFCLAAIDPSHMSTGTSLDDAIAALRLVEDTRVALGM